MARAAAVSGSRLLDLLPVPVALDLPDKALFVLLDSTKFNIIPSANFRSVPAA
eukprot:SAG31_NODE_21441_length_549_cov_1.420000_1_plen_52_part_01